MKDEQQREQRLRQALSALVDGEAHELEVSQVLARARGHDDVKARWARYQLVSAALQAGGQARLEQEETPPPPAKASAGLWSFAAAAALTLALTVLLRTTGGESAVPSDLAASPATPPAAFALAGAFEAGFQPVALGGRSDADRKGASLLRYGEASAWVSPATVRGATQRHLQTLMRRHAELNMLDSAGALVPAVRLVALADAP